MKEMCTCMKSTVSQSIDLQLAWQHLLSSKELVTGSSLQPEANTLQFHNLLGERGLLRFRNTDQASVFKVVGSNLDDSSISSMGYNDKKYELGSMSSMNF